MLNRRAREFAVEICSHDWSDAPYRLDRAGHDRRLDSRPSADCLSVEETDRLRTNVVWMVAQVLKHEDPNLDLWEFAAACGVPRSITHRSNGSPSGTISNGLRWNDTAMTSAAEPGAPMWLVNLEVDVANLDLFRKLLVKEIESDPWAADESFDPMEDVDPEGLTGGENRRSVSFYVREWDGDHAADRAVRIVEAARPHGEPQTEVFVYDFSAFDPEYDWFPHQHAAN